MKNKNLKNQIFNVFVLLIIIIVVSFIGKQVFDAFRTPKIITTSDIPVLNKDKLEKVNNLLDEKDEISQFSKPNFSEFVFGKAEPFR